VHIYVGLHCRLYIIKSGRSVLSVLSAELFMTLNIHEGHDGWPECVAVAVVLDVPDVFSRRVVTA